jgi:protein SYS1
MINKFRSNVWDPLLIIAQIISMQCGFYASLLILVYLSTFFVSNTNDYFNTLDQIFDFNRLTFKSTYGYLLSIIFLLNSLIW